MSEKREDSVPPQEHKTKSENMDTDHVIALLQNSALNKLEEAITADGRSTEEILHQLDAAKQNNDYDAERGLIEAIRQRLDIADIRGGERPEELLDALRNVYAADEYSQVRQNSIMDEIPKDNPDVIVHILLDEKFSNSTSLLYSLESNDVRERIYQALKNNNAVDKVVTLVSATKNLPEQIRLFEDLYLWLQSNSSDEAKKVMRSPYGKYCYLKRDIAVELLSQDRETLNRFLESGMIDIDGLENYIKDKPDELLVELLLHVITIDDASRVIKFIHSKDTLLAAIHKLDHAALPPEYHDAVINNMQRLATAFDAPPQILSLGYLRKRDENMKSYEISNKFIIALKDGEDCVTIAWSNTRRFSEHKHLAQHIGNISKALCTGGEVEIIELDDGGLQVVFKGHSGTFGPYNHTFLEGFKQALSEHLQNELHNNKIEVIIKPSKI